MGSIGIVLNRSIILSVSPESVEPLCIWWSVEALKESQTYRSTGKVEMPVTSDKGEK